MAQKLVKENRGLLSNRLLTYIDTDCSALDIFDKNMSSGQQVTLAFSSWGLSAAQADGRLRNSHLMDVDDRAGT